MKRYSPIQKFIVFACSCVLILILTSQHADAARRSRVLSIALFASGMSLQVGGTLLKASAQDSYDAYLNAAIQAGHPIAQGRFSCLDGMPALLCRASVSDVSDLLCFFLSIVNLIHPRSRLNLQKVFSLPASARKPLEQIYAQSKINFTNYRFGNIGLLSPRPSFQLLPHYDFQSQRASLRLLHVF